MKKEDLSGKKFGKLLVLIESGKNKSGNYMWLCLCDCGKKCVVSSGNLRKGHTKSCGCARKEAARKTGLKASHKCSQNGDKYFRLYEVWQHMKERCENKNAQNYKYYGGRGICVCDEWKESFEAFYSWALSSGYNDDLTIDRIDNDGDYTPENCRWATQKEQSRNRSTNINITIGNSTRTLTEWCEIFNLDFKTVNARYQRNGFIGIDELFNRT